MTMRYVHPAEEHKREAAGKIENFKAASAMKTMRVEDCNSLRRLVGAWRFELQTSCAQGRRATRLRYAPTVTALFILKHFPTLLLIRVVIFGLTVPKLCQILY
jgi:hypothetical protein